MQRSRKRYRPSLLYVFVTLFLAAFLLLFTIWREPGTAYETATTFTAEAPLAELTTRLCSSTAVQDALVQAAMVTDSHPDMPEIAAEISERLKLTANDPADPAAGYSLILTTTHPLAATRLLETLTEQANAAGTLVHTTQAPGISSVQGGSVKEGQLVVLSVLSWIVGMCGVVLTRRAYASSVLVSKDDVEQLTGLPVLTDFGTNETGPGSLRISGHTSLARRRMSTLALRAAELTVAAVFFLMVYQLATDRDFSQRFVRDPLAAYGEVLTETIG